MKKTISILLALSVMICATSAMAATGLTTVENNSENTTFATSPADVESMPTFEVGDVVSFDITGATEGDDITFISYKYDAESEKIDNSTVQYINQYVAKGESQAVTYKVRDLAEGVYLLKTKVGENDVYSAYYYVGTVSSGTVAVTGVTLDRESMTLKEGDHDTITATVAPENATNMNVTWTSSDETVATVADGVVTAVKEGSATITATTEDGSFTATCAVTVTANASTVKIGDVNKDNKVTNKDATALGRYLAKWTGYDDTTIDKAAADTNADGKVTNKDATALGRYLAKWTGYETLPYIKN